VLFSCRKFPKRAEISLLCQNKIVEGIQKYIVQYVGYLDEIRRRVLILVKIFAGVFLVGFIATGPLIRLVIEKLAIENVLIVTTSPFQLVNLAMSSGFFLASVIIAPFFAYHLYTFLSPGLLATEKRLFVSLIPLSLVLFFVGFSYGFTTMYFATESIAQLNVSLGVVNYWDIGKFVSEIVLTSSLLGLIFQFPIAITFMIRVGFVRVEFLRSKRRHAIVVIFFLVSLLPPTDGLSLILMALPMWIIYELTILVNSRKMKLAQPHY